MHRVVLSAPEVHLCRNGLACLTLYRGLYVQLTVDYIRISFYFLLRILTSFPICDSVAAVPVRTGLGWTGSRCDGITRGSELYQCLCIDLD